MSYDLISVASFAFITTFTPGPNNISSATMGLNYGYRTTLPYILGITSGFFLIMLLCNLVTSALGAYLARFEGYLAYFGAAYILYLAIHILFASYQIEEDKASPLGFTTGMLLQIINPKVIIYGLTLYSTFLLQTPRGTAGLILLPLAFAGLSFCSTSTWSIAGSTISRYLNARLRLAVNGILALTMLMLALQMVHIL